MRGDPAGRARFPSSGARPAWGWRVPDPIARAERLTYRYPEAAGPALRDVTLELGEGSFTVLAGTSGSGKSTLLRALCGLVPHFHGGEVAGELEVGGMSVREHGPGELAAVCGTVFQDPETQVVLGGVRAELSLPLEHRGVDALRHRPGRGGGGAHARHRAPARAPHRHAVGRRAPARGDRRRAGAPSRPAAARRAHLPARPGGGRRADLDAAAPERGVGHGRGDRRAPARALPSRGRPRAWRSTGARSSATPRRGSSWPGRPRTATRS